MITQVKIFRFLAKLLLIIFFLLLLISKANPKPVMAVCTPADCNFSCQANEICTDLFQPTVCRCLAAGDSNNPFGTINPPPGIDKYGSFCEGLLPFINNILRLFFIIGGLYAFLNIVFAGFQFINARGDPKGIQTAWGKIWQSFVGLLIFVASFLIAAIIGIVLFGSATAILKPVITGAPGAVCP